VSSLIGIAVSNTAVILSHTLQFALMLAVFSNLVQHTWWICLSRRKRNHFSRFGPAYVVMIAMLLIMIQPTYYVFKDAKHIPKASYAESLAYHICTVTGYILVIVATLWAADIWEKLQRLQA
jgi:hypothetical protein